MCEPAESTNLNAEPKILNAEYNFIRLAPNEIRNYFAGIPMKVLLSEGETLYRFYEAGFNGVPSDYWLSLETYHRLRRASSVPDWAVWRTANSRRQSAPAIFCRATLLNKVYAFAGLVRLPGSSAFTPGDPARSMLWIPGLSTGDFFLRTYSLADPTLVRGLVGTQ
jgi:hypothetical protein